MRLRIFQLTITLGFFFYPFASHSQSMQPVIFSAHGQQVNIGNQTSFFAIQNTSISNGKFNITSIGNMIGVSAEEAITTMFPQYQRNVGAALQSNSGNQNVVVNISGTTDVLSNNQINASAIGNVKNYSYTNTAIASTLNNAPFSQINSSNQNVALAMTQSPINGLQINLSAIGNLQSFIIK